MNNQCMETEVGGMSDCVHEVTLDEKHRANEYWYLGGCDGEMPYPELSHEHVWNDDDYCVICGADGRA